MLVSFTFIIIVTVLQINNMKNLNEKSVQSTASPRIGIYLKLKELQDVLIREQNGIRIKTNLLSNLEIK